MENCHSDESVSTCSTMIAASRQRHLRWLGISAALILGICGTIDTPTNAFADDGAQSALPRVTITSPIVAAGTGIKGAKITTTLADDTILCTAVVADDNSWECTFTEIQTGGVTVKVTQTEKGHSPSEVVITKIVTPDDSWVLEVIRHSGADRYTTSQQLNAAYSRRGGTLFLATGVSFPDALVISPAVIKEKGSLILTRSSKLSASSKLTIKDLEPQSVYIAGGEGAISESVEEELAEILPPATTVERVGGKDRYETSAMVFAKFFADDKNYTGTSAFVATGRLFPDALSASAVAGALNAPVLLVAGTAASTIPATTIKALQDRGITSAFITGGSGAVSQTVESQLRAHFTVERKGGDDRFATNQLLNSLLDAKLPTTPVSGVWLATGADFPDALSASVYAGKQDQRLYLSRSTCIPGTTVNSVIKTTESRVRTVHLVGGVGVLSQDVFDLATCE